MKFSETATTLACSGCSEPLKQIVPDFYICRSCGVEIDDREKPERGVKVTGVVHG